MGFYPQIHVGFDHSGTLIPSKWAYFLRKPSMIISGLFQGKILTGKSIVFCLPSKSKGAPVNLPLI